MIAMLLRLIALACVCLSLVGFTTAHLPALSLSERLAAPGGVSPLLPRDRIEAMFARLPHREGFVPVNGVPLYWRALDPGDYGLRYRYAGGTADNRMDFQLDFDAAARPSARKPRGTVVLLHGWMMDGGSLLLGRWNWPRPATAPSAWTCVTTAVPAPRRPATAPARARTWWRCCARCASAARSPARCT